MINMDLDRYKIAIIINVTDEASYKLTIKSLTKLIVPAKYKVEIITTQKEINIATAYNRVMKSSSAKYKIYLRAGIEIINKNFFGDIINIFKTNWNIGIIGMSGVKIIPTDANIFVSSTRIGKIRSINNKNIVFSDCNDSYEFAAAIDDYLMVTQYDINWRNDLFSSEGLYNIAQCIEFKRNYYSTAVAGQKEPWILYREKNIIMTQDERERFFDEYSRDIYPLVSILIPTYNRSEYFEIALKSALMQTYRNIEIIVGDDSTDDRTEKIVRRYQSEYKNIVYIKNTDVYSNAAERAYANYRGILHKCHGKYVNYLNDDDVFAPKKIEKMMNYYLQYPNISLVTSYRRLIDELGNEVNAEGYPRWIVEKDCLVKAEKAVKSLIMNFNFIGEPTTALIKRCDIEENLGMFAGKSFNCINDMPQWIASLQKGDLIYIKEPLSSMRIHSKQRSKDLFTQVVFKVELMHMYLLTYQKKIINRNDLVNLLLEWLQQLGKNIRIFKLLKQQKKMFFYDEDIIEEFIFLKKQAEKIVNNNEES
ncbi:glycosyltransferase [Pectinatus brassicae]|uniref:Glycosyltransferase involved in cell wall biosynthesis n=1 Tax=Pectinatus brassicae TaxID=862415 RepID=A0A840UTU7_9FIRM|nr:glycosyltransferase [Pectinatus brassicae]MBB5337552.1 glycosyltransferase involved in cell wall biosynthesis [Pectinatus brassicae]